MEGRLLKGLLKRSIMYDGRQLQQITMQNIIISINFFNFATENMIIHSYPTPNAPVKQLNLNYTPQNSPNNLQIINQLRNENDMLKRQLQQIIKQQSKWPKAIHSHNNVISANQSFQNTQEEEAEIFYRKKMSKIKMRKSNQKSFEQTYLHHSKSKEYPKNEQPVINGKVPLIILANSQSKVIPISKEKCCKQQRNLDGQYKSTARKFNLSQQKKYPLFNKTSPVSPNSSKMYEDKVIIKPFGHLRMESAQSPNLHGRSDKYIIPNSPVNSKFSIGKSDQNSKHNLSQKQFIQKINNFTAKNSREKVQTLPQGYPLQSKNVINAKKIEPKRNIYVSAQSHEQLVPKQDYVNKDNQFEQESNLSIQLNIKNAKGNRKLRHNVYMDEE